MIVYSDFQTLREYYKTYVQKQILFDNGNVFISLFYETTNSIRQVLAERLNDLEFLYYERENFLSIMDALKLYYYVKKNNLYFIDNMIGYAHRKGRNGISILDDVGPFFFKGKLQELVEYELSLPKKFITKRKELCLYHQKDFNRLSEDQKQKIINHHDIVLKIF